MVPGQPLDADTVTQPRGRAWSGCSVALTPARAAESEHVTNVPSGGWHGRTCSRMEGRFHPLGHDLAARFYSP
jgi:hypothetical protein